MWDTIARLGDGRPRVAKLILLDVVGFLARARPRKREDPVHLRMGTRAEGNAPPSPLAAGDGAFERPRSSGFAVSLSV